ncbi:ribitol-5-phosphate transferase FKTN-like [Ciona intestinalis]
MSVGIFRIQNKLLFLFGKVLCVVCAVVIILTQLWVVFNSLPNEKHETNDVMLKLCNIFEKLNVRLVLFDSDILQAMEKDSQHFVSLKLLQSNSKATMITFGVLGSQFVAQKEEIMKAIEEIFLLSYVSHVQDPRENIPVQVPGHLWIVDNHHIIHIMMSHKRGNGYLWIAPISNTEWGKIIQVLDPFVEGGILGFGAKVQRYAQAVESNVFETVSTLPFYDSKLFIPFETTSFLEDFKSSQFIECNHMRADIFKQKYEQNITEKDVKYILTSKRILTTASKVFNELKIPFTLSSGMVSNWMYFLSMKKWTSFGQVLPKQMEQSINCLNPSIQTAGVIYWV